MRPKCQRQEGEAPEEAEQEEGKEQREHGGVGQFVGNGGGRHCSHLGVQVADEGDDIQPHSHSANCQVRDGRKIQAVYFRNLRLCLWLETRGEPILRNKEL